MRDRGKCCVVIRLLIFWDLSGEPALCFLFLLAVTVLPGLLHVSGPCCWSPGSDWSVIRRLQGSLAFLDHWYCAVFPPDSESRHPRSCSSYRFLSCAGVATAELRSSVCKKLLPPPDCRLLDAIAASSFLQQTRAGTPVVSDWSTAACRHATRHHSMAGGTQTADGTSLHIAQMWCWHQRFCPDILEMVQSHQFSCVDL